MATHDSAVPSPFLRNPYERISIPLLIYCQQGFALVVNSSRQLAQPVGDLGRIRITGVFLGFFDHDRVQQPCVILVEFDRLEFLPCSGPWPSAD